MKNFELFKTERNLKVYIPLNATGELEEIKKLIKRVEANKIYFFKIESSGDNEYETGIAIELSNGNIEIYETQLNNKRPTRNAEIEEIVKLVENLSTKSNKLFFMINKDKFLNFDKIKETPEILIPYLKTAERIN